MNKTESVQSRLDTVRNVFGRVWIRHIVFLILLAAVVVVANATFTRSYRQTNFFGDESGWIASANYHTDLLLRRDFDHEAWDPEPMQSWGSMNPQLGKFILGIGLRAHPDREPKDIEFSKVYHFSKGLQWNIQQGRVPYEGTVLRARSVNRIFAVACVGILFAALSMYFNVWAGLLVVGLLLTNQMIVTPFSWALTDTYYNLFLLLSFLGSALMLRVRGQGGLICAGVMAGLLAGLACSVKLPGIAVGGLLFVGMLAYRFSQRDLSWKACAYSIMAFGAVSITTIYALNPFFWPTSDLANLLEFPKIFGRSKEMLALQESVSPSWDPALPKALMVQRVIFIAFARYPFEWLFFVIGFAYSGWRTVSAVRARTVDRVAVPLIYFLANYGFLVFFIQVNYRRHYLPTVFAVKMLTAIGVAITIAAIWAGIGKVASAIKARQEHGGSA